MPNKHQKKNQRRQREVAKALAKQPPQEPPTHSFRRNQDHDREVSCSNPIGVSQVTGSTWEFDPNAFGYHPEMSHLEGFQFTADPDEEPSDSLYRQVAISHIPLDSLAECSPSGHPRQAWAILSGQQEQPTLCSVCNRIPDFPSSGGTLSVRGFDTDAIDEDIDEETTVEHSIFESVEDGNLFFRFQSSKE